MEEVSRMTDVKDLYEKYWEGKKEEYGSYVRNLALPKLFKKGELVLDVGCGDGVVAEFLKNNIGVEIMGIDISKEAVEKARQRGIDAKVLSSEDRFPFGDSTFDTVFWGDNIEHLFNPKVTCLEIRRVLKKGGRLILSCPNMGYWRYRFYYLTQGSLPDTEWTELASWEWSHIRFFNLKILKEFLKICGFEQVTKVIGVSPRRLDKPLLPIAPSLFGMILIVEAK